MRITVTLDDDLLAAASAALGVSERSVVLHEGLRSLIQRETARRLAKFGGSAPALSVPSRRRPVTAATKKRAPSHRK